MKKSVLIIIAMMMAFCLTTSVSAQVIDQAAVTEKAQAAAEKAAQKAAAKAAAKVQKEDRKSVV